MAQPYPSLSTRLKRQGIVQTLRDLLSIPDQKTPLEQESPDLPLEQQFSFSPHRVLKTLRQNEDPPSHSSRGLACRLWLTTLQGWCIVIFHFTLKENSMKEDVLQAYREVEQAMERYNLVLDEYVASLRNSDLAIDKKKYERMSAGTRAMLDSSSIYLSYAKFVAYGMPESEDLIEDEDLQA